MAKLLFWNINKKDLKSHIVTLCKDHDIDVLILAESTLNDVDMQLLLNNGEDRKYIQPLNPSNRLKYFVRYQLDSFTIISDDGGVSIRNIKPPVGLDIILVSLHLSSKTNLSDIDQAMLVGRIQSCIEEAEARIGHNRTLVIGDFNMNPFEPGLVSSEGFHAIQCRKIASKGSRTVYGKDKKFFYNPMWNFMGDVSGNPPGTYYYQGGPLSYFWNTFDQVLLRPDLLKYYSDENLKIIKKIGNTELVRSSKVMESDHLPIIIELNIEMEVACDEEKLVG